MRPKDEASLERTAKHQENPKEAEQRPGAPGQGILRCDINTQAARETCRSQSTQYWDQQQESQGTKHHETTQISAQPTSDGNILTTDSSTEYYSAL